jgi:hypothetical protein
MPKKQEAKTELIWLMGRKTTTKTKIRLAMGGGAGE